MARYCTVKRWKQLEDALSMKTKPFPRPWRAIEFSKYERVGVGNIGAELTFGTETFDLVGKRHQPRIIFFNEHKDVDGPIRTYWYVMWHRNYGFREFDIRWIWEFLGESEPTAWMTFSEAGFTEFILGRLASVREAFLRCPEERRDELIDKIVYDKFCPLMPAGNPAGCEKTGPDFDMIPF